MKKVRIISAEEAALLVNDGDTIYTLASGKLDTQASAAVPLDLLGMLAVRALQTAIVNGAKTAKTSHGIPGAAK